jgi:hypothetical protein
MAMEGGTVHVRDDATITGSGLARHIVESIKPGVAAEIEAKYQAVFATPTFQALDPSVQDTVRAEKTTALLSSLRWWASIANGLAPALVTYLQQHAAVSIAGVVATVDTTTSLGRTPTPNDPDEPIVPPSEAVELPVTGALGATTLALQ